MQKRKIWENFLQWVLPCVLLVIALVLSIYDFNNKMDAAIQTVVDDQAEQIGLYYAAGVEDKLKALGNITDAVASIMASRPDRSDAFLNEKLDTLMKAFTEIPPWVMIASAKDLVPVTVMGSALISIPKAFLSSLLISLTFFSGEIPDNSIITGISFAGNR